MNTPTLGQAECHTCGGIPSLVKGYVLRKHIDMTKPPHIPRRDRVCFDSGTRNWSALDEETSKAALAHWGEEDA